MILQEVQDPEVRFRKQFKKGSKGTADVTGGISQEPDDNDNNSFGMTDYGLPDLSEEREEKTYGTSGNDHTVQPNNPNTLPTIGEITETAAPYVGAGLVALLIGFMAKRAWRRSVGRDTSASTFYSRFDDTPSFYERSKF